MSSTVIVPWYATGFRAQRFEPVLNEVAAVALRYGASSYAVYRSREDTYRFQQVATFAEKLDWERYWEGPEMIEFRTRYSSWYQVPVLYGWWTRTVSGSVEEQPLEPPAVAGTAVTTTNGHGDGSLAHEA